MTVVRCGALLVAALVGCSKSSTDNKQPSAGSGSAGSGSVGSGSAGSSAEGSAAAEPVEAATVVGPTKSATGTLEVTGKLTGTFEWKKKDQKQPISCAWNAEKEIGGMRVDLSDGAGKLLTVAIDVPPSELGPARLDVMSADLPEPQKAYRGFKVRGEEDGHMTVTFENVTLPEPEADPADAKKKASKADKAAAADKPAPLLTLNGTLEVSCPPKK